MAMKSKQQNDVKWQGYKLGVLAAAHELSYSWDQPSMAKDPHQELTTRRKRSCITITRQDRRVPNQGVAHNDRQAIVRINEEA